MPAATVEEFLAAVPAGMRAALEDLRQKIRDVLPDASEVISYGVPTFKRAGRSIVGYGAATKHCSLFVMSPAVVEALAADLAGYDLGKGTIRFPADRPLPAALVTKVVRARIAEVEAAATRRRR
jgi:uncharacterized protein YdhG (YjbR/CyaY superfamily)